MPHPFRIVRRTLTLHGWRGTATVAHLTDLHFGWVTRVSLLESAVATANAANADVTVLTGDFVGRGPRFLPTLTRTLSRLEGRCIAVLGNHDHFVGADRVADALIASGVEVLRNRWTLLDLPGGTLPLACMDDAITHHDDAHATTQGLPGPALGLSHDPSAAPKLWARGAPLVLSGHTHGGQVHVPRITPWIHRKLGQPFLAGHYRRDEGQVYVNTGLGGASLPMRLGHAAQREVALLRIDGDR